MTLTDEIIDEKGMDKIRWQFALLYGVCGAQRTMSPSLCTFKAGWGTPHLGYGRCKWHAGCSTGCRTLEGKMAQKRAVIKLRTKDGGRMTQLTKEVLAPDERETYTSIVNFLLENYDVEDFVADQIAILKVYQMYYVLPNEGDPSVTSEMMRKWAVEEKLTKKSRDKDTGMTNINLALIVEGLYNPDVIDVEVQDDKQ
jgi:hypothetical protein